MACTTSIIARWAERGVLQVLWDEGSGVEAEEVPCKGIEEEVGEVEDGERQVEVTEERLLQDGKAETSTEEEAEGHRRCRAWVGLVVRDLFSPLYLSLNSFF